MPPILDQLAINSNMRQIETIATALERARCQRIAIQVRDFAAQNPKLDAVTRKHCAATADQIAALIEAMPA